MDSPYAVDPLGPPPGHVDLVVVIDEFAVGGVASLYSTIAAAASAQGLRVIVVGRPGPSRENLDWGGAQTLTVAAWDAMSLDTIDGLLARARRVMWQASPPLVSMLVSCETHAGSTIVFHGSARLTAGWFGQELIDLLTSTLRARPSIAVMAPSAALVTELSELLGLSTERFRVLSHVSSAHGPAPGQRARPRPRVVVPTRVSHEKRFVVRAGLELARARRLPLVVVGEGDDGAWVDQLHESSGVEVQRIDDGRIHDHIAHDDVVVAVGLIAIEAARYCGAVVAASRADDGALAGVVSPATLDDLYEHNFLGGEHRVDPDAAWSQIDLLSDDDRLDIQRRIDALADPRRACGQVLDACDGDTGEADAQALSALVGATARAWVRQSGTDQEWIAELLRAREWLTGHRTDLEGWVADLERALAFHQERGDRFEKLYLALLERGTDQ